jgi:hypothetical protein
MSQQLPFDYASDYNIPAIPSKTANAPEMGATTPGAELPVLSGVVEAEDAVSEPVGVAEAEVLEALTAVAATEREEDFRLRAR